MLKKSTIIIPTVNNFDYLKLCINSIIKNSTFHHELIVHINGKDPITENYLIKKNITYTKSDNNVGLCTGVNLASKKSTTEFIIYSHDDMYYLPKWDLYIFDEIKKLPNNLFYFSPTQISHYPKNKGVINHIYFDAGNDIKNFQEDLLLSEFNDLEFYDMQGSHWAPHIIHRDIWNKIGGFSEEFNPGFGSDPDLNMKLWQEGVRIFKSINKSRIYHFGSLTTRKNKNIKRNDGRKIFLLKWKMTIDYFVKYYLQRGSKYKASLKEHKVSINNLLPFISSKIKYFIKKINEK